MLYTGGKSEGPPSQLFAEVTIGIRACILKASNALRKHAGKVTPTATWKGRGRTGWEDQRADKSLTIRAGYPTGTGRAWLVFRDI